MPAPSHCFWLLAMLALPAFDDSLSGQDAGIPEFSASPGSLFTAAEISRARRVAVENRERRESYIRAREDDDVVMLEPYIVEGDDSLLIARLRRDLDRLAGAGRPWRVTVPASVLHELALARRFDDQFFHAPSAGAPRDAVQVVDQLGLAIGIGKALWEQRAGDIFRAPAAASDR